MRLTINGKRLTERQTEKFNFFISNSPKFRDRFLTLAEEAGITHQIRSIVHVD